MLTRRAFLAGLLGSTAIAVVGLPKIPEPAPVLGVDPALGPDRCAVFCARLKPETLAWEILEAAERDIDEITGWHVVSEWREWSGDRFVDDATIEAAKAA